MYVHRAPTFSDLTAKLRPEEFARVIGAPADDRAYLHWDKLRNLTPPDGLTHEEWWLRLKLARLSGRRQLPLRSTDGQQFSYTLPDPVLSLLHLVDQQCSGQIAMEEVVTADDQARRHYLVNSLMEEAIRSSQLEGATTSRHVAKDLLQTGREPANRSERMIFNNYNAMLFMRDGIGESLTSESVLELHRILTEGTLDNPDAAGRLQRPDGQRVAVFDREGGSVLHEPPPAVELQERLRLLCEFANSKNSPEQFVHPVIRALILHFWIGYDHPFEDGNGRTARALFYWSMRTQGYWLVEYLSISRILRHAPAKYARAFVYSETDDQDATYFVLYQLGVIERAIKELHAHLRRKVAEVQEVESLLRDEAGLNHRQLALISHALRHPETTYTFGTHARSHGVTHETGRSDLAGLESRGLLIRRQSGRQYRFTVPVDLADRLRTAA